MEECASKCTDQIPPHLNFCTLSKIKSKLKKHNSIRYSFQATNSSSVKIASIGTNLDTKDIVGTQIRNCAIISLPPIQTNPNHVIMPKPNLLILLFALFHFNAITLSPLSIHTHGK